MLDAVHRLLEWYKAGRRGRYVRSSISPGFGQPQYVMVIFEVDHDAATDSRTLGGRSVTVDGDVDDFPDLIRLALGRWERGEFDKMPRVLSEALHEGR